MRRRAITAGAALAFAALTTLAAAGVLVYENDASSRSEYRELRKLGGGKACGRFGRKDEVFGIEVRKGPADCALRTPVTADGKKPDHELEAKAKVLRKETARALRDEVFVAVAVRASADSYYQLRVFPKDERWELRRKPKGDGFPITGPPNPPIEGRKANELRVQAFGRTVSAWINGEKVVNGFADPNPPKQVDGTKTLISLGHRKDTKRNASGFFDELKIRLPNP
jgi:hypothetical protein